ncbi:hypothetical protein CERZMDRAFT_97781 [Cercospora zeae-maydis SCOH1-5]|uniref:Uncharacterized protein n=1 Tax=Cercospora zeae-maydis SCOH1-5 TaxID=717836 RepID=A0A6A6FEN7_9PEZI|nr:hypothetical protein CERZMDRAFT_97781 [Cercospora zeae-maydis SCOH1-5]
MTSICTRCALRLHRVSQQETQHIVGRAFSQATTRSREFPTFAYTANDDLNDALADLRNKHLVPAFLTTRERKLIFSPKHKDYLKQNPQTVEFGGDEIELQWINRLTDRPAREALTRQALEQIFETKDDKTWSNVAKLLQANKILKKPVDERMQAKIVRKALHQGKILHVLSILQQSRKTGMSLKTPEVLETLIQGLRDLAQRSNWNKAHTEKALKEMNIVAWLLESEEHGDGGKLRKDDPRRSPKVLGVMLELAAVYAYKHTEGKDVTGVVQRYADRLLSCMDDAQVSPSDEALFLVERGPQTSFQQYIPILHGTFVANTLLREQMPQADKARQVIANYEARLSELAAVLESRAPEKGTYDYVALESWRRMILSRPVL